jgi:hypothetical protein
MGWEGEPSDWLVVSVSMPSTGESGFGKAARCIFCEGMALILEDVMAKHE